MTSRCCCCNVDTTVIMFSANRETVPPRKHLVRLGEQGLTQLR